MRTAAAGLLSVAALLLTSCGARAPGDTPVDPEPAVLSRSADVSHGWGFDAPTEGTALVHLRTESGERSLEHAFTAGERVGFGFSVVKDTDDGLRPLRTGPWLRRCAEAGEELGLGRCREPVRRGCASGVRRRSIAPTWRLSRSVPDRVRGERRPCAAPYRDPIVLEFLT